MLLFFVVDKKKNGHHSPVAKHSHPIEQTQYEKKVGEGSRLYVFISYIRA